MARKRNKAPVPAGAWGRLEELRDRAAQATANDHGLELVRGQVEPVELGAPEPSAPPGGEDAVVQEESDAKGGLKRLPAGERPRERLLKDGGAALTDAELVAVLLRVGCRGKTAVEMAQEILDEHGGLGGLVWSDSRRLRRHGLGQAKAATVLAGIELARRLVRVQLPQQDLLDNPGAVSSYLLIRFGRLDQ
ncbi:MAG: UPF0758 domain-containing protein [Acidobacteriota bacterium]